MSNSSAIASTSASHAASSVLAYLRRCNSKKNSTSGATDFATDAQFHLRCAEQTESLRTVIEFVCSSSSATTSVIDTITQILEAVCREVQEQIETIQVRQREYQLELANQKAEEENQQQATISKQQQKKKVKGGKIPAAQQRAIDHQRDMITMVRSCWIYLESVRVSTDIARQLLTAAAAASLNAVLITVLASTISSVVILTQSTYSQSQKTAVEVLANLSSLVPQLRKELHAWCLASLADGVSGVEATAASAATSSLSVSSSASSSLQQQSLRISVKPDARTLCMLIVTLLQSNSTSSESSASFESSVWEGTLTTMRLHPSLAHRSAIMRILLPHLLQPSNLHLDRIHKLFGWLRQQWNEGVVHHSNSMHSKRKHQLEVHESGRTPSSPYLASNFLAEILLHSPQLDLLYHLTCSHYVHFFTLLNSVDQRIYDEWIINVLLGGLSSGVPICVKQCIYLIQSRQMLKSQLITSGLTTTEVDECFQAGDYTAEEWSCFLHLWKVLESASVHLMENGYPRIEVLLRASPAMSLWLELILWKSFTNQHPSLSSAAFTTLHSLCQAEAAKTTQPSSLSAIVVSTSFSFSSSSSSSSSPVPITFSWFNLTPEMVIGPILSCFDESNLFSADKLRRGAHRLGDQYLQPFLLTYMNQIDKKDTAQLKQFIRLILQSMANPRSALGPSSLTAQLASLANFRPSHVLEESDIAVLCTILQVKIQAASNRLRMELVVYAIQVFALHIDVSRCSSSVTDMLNEFPDDWLRPNCASYQLVQHTLNSSSHFATILSTLIDQHFEFIATLTSSASSISDTLQSATKRNASVVKTLMFVTEESALQTQICRQIEERIKVAFTSALEALTPIVPLLVLLSFLCDFFDVVTASRSRHESAAIGSDNPQLETLSIPLSASSQRCIDQLSQLQQTGATSSTSSASSSGSTPWSHRISWCLSLIQQYGVTSTSTIESHLQSHTQANASTDEKERSIRRKVTEQKAARHLVAHYPTSHYFPHSSVILTHLTGLLSSLLRHSSLTPLKYRLLAWIVSRLSSIHTATHRFTASPILFTLLNSILQNFGAREFEPPASDASSLDAEYDSQQVSAWLFSTTSSIDSQSSPSLLSRSLVRYLVRYLIRADIGKKPSDVWSNQWKDDLQIFQLQRWQAIHNLLQIDVSVESSVFDACVESLESATPIFIESIFHSIRLLLPSHIRRYQLNNGGAPFPLDQLDTVYATCWNSFRDVHVELTSYTCVLAFLATIFEPVSLAQLGNHEDGAPFKRMFRTLLEYGARHTRFLVYLSFFATHAWSQTLSLSLLPLYYADLLHFCAYQPLPGLETDMIAEKFHAWNLVHLVHNMPSEPTELAQQPKRTTTHPFIQSHQVGRAESLIRCSGLLLLEQLPKRIASEAVDSIARHSVHLFVDRFAREILQHPQMHNVVGLMAGEGSTEFVTKCHLWQTLCVFTPLLNLCPQAQHEAIHRLLQQHTWKFFDHPMTSVLRHLLEVFISHLYSIMPSAIESELVPQIEVYRARPTMIASILFILSQATMFIQNKEVRERQACLSLLHLHAFTTCNFGHVRLVVQYFYHRLFRDFAPASWQVDANGSDADSSVSSSASSSFSSVDSNLNLQCLRSMMSYLSRDADMQALRVRQDAYVERFNTIVSSTVLGILTQEDTNEHHYFFTRPFIDQLTAVQGEYLSELRSHYDDRIYGVNGDTDFDVEAQSAATTAAASGSASTHSTLTNFQQKIDCTPLASLTALGDLTHPPDSLDDLTDVTDSYVVSSGVSLRSVVTQHTQSTRQSVIVVASLVDKVPNIAGLARTCEIFLCDRLMVNSLSVLEDREFRNIAVTADKWLDIQQLAPADISSFLTQRQAEGYTCIALEQSAASIRLPEYQFPRRCVILLGAEKQGTPIDLLNQVDHCVEIPQLGIIRSLNVHVSGSILLWEYTRQQLLGLTAPA